jgi:FkbM family methyltransferase
MNKLGQRIRQVLIHAYVFVFARPQTQYINQILFNLASKGKGYNNYSPLLSKSGEMKLIRRLANLNPSNFFDVGANIGQYSTAFAEISKSNVFAFEPMVGSFKVLKKNCEIFGERISCFNLALGDRNYRTTISFNGDFDQLASISNEIKEIPYVGLNNVNSAEVTVRTLDSIFEDLYSSGQINCIDILKIDTEGFEYEVLVGASELLKSHPPMAVIIEFNWHQLMKGNSLFSFHQLLKGYSVFQVLPYGSGLRSVDPKIPSNNLFYYSNFLFLREDLSI